MNTKKILQQLEALNDSERYALGVSQNRSGSQMVVTIMASKDFGPHLAKDHRFASLILNDSAQHVQATGFEVDIKMSLEPVQGELSTIIDHNVGVTYATQLAIQLRRSLVW